MSTWNVYKVSSCILPISIYEWIIQFGKRKAGMRKRIEFVINEEEKRKYNGQKIPSFSATISYIYILYCTYIFDVANTFLNRYRCDKNSPEFYMELRHLRCFVLELVKLSLGHMPIRIAWQNDYIRPLNTAWADVMNTWRAKKMKIHFHVENFLICFESLRFILFVNCDYWRRKSILKNFMCFFVRAALAREILCLQ